MHPIRKANSFGVMYQSLIVRAAISLCLMLALSFGLKGASHSPGQTGFEDRANLALRAIGHQLLQGAGDRTSAVPPVQTLAPGHYYLPLETAVNYDSLKELVNGILLQSGLPTDYSLALYDCDTEAIFLGYISQNGADTDPACSGRAQVSDCYTLSIRFPLPARENASRQWLWLLPLSVFVGIALGYRLKGQVKKKKIIADGDVLPPQNTLGRLSVDFENQVVRSPEGERRLTFQEARLLRLFWQHPNRVIRREEILEQVWGDEGVIVGRSVDVFVSRLRKALKPEPAINLASVHGVGYKLEVNLNFIADKT